MISYVSYVFGTARLKISFTTYRGLSAELVADREFRSGRHEGAGAVV